MGQRATRMSAPSMMESKYHVKGQTEVFLQQSFTQISDMGIMCYVRTLRRILHAELALMKGKKSKTARPWDTSLKCWETCHPYSEQHGNTTWHSTPQRQASLYIPHRLCCPRSASQGIERLSPPQKLVGLQLMLSASVRFAGDAR